MNYNIIAEQVRDYSEQYGCNIEQALEEWSGDGPDGSFGLTRNEQIEVAALLGLNLNP